MSSDEHDWSKSARDLCPSSSGLKQSTTTKKLKARKVHCGLEASNLLGYVRTIPDSAYAGTETIADSGSHIRTVISASLCTDPPPPLSKNRRRGGGSVHRLISARFL